MSYYVTHFGVEPSWLDGHPYPLCNSPNKNARLVWAREVVTCKRCNRRLREGYFDKEPRIGARKQVVAQLPIQLIDAIRRQALHLTMTTGKHVTQQQVMETILSKELII
jgi:hypothetical protein